MFQPKIGLGDEGTGPGIVVAQDDVGPPTTADVMWQSTGMVTADIPQSELRRVYEGAIYNSLRVGSWVQLNSYPLPGNGTPKSPAASGLMLDAFMLGEFGSDEPEGDIAYARISINNGDGTILTAEDPGPDGAVATAPPANTINTGKPGQRNS